MIKHIVNGESVLAESGGPFKVCNPATGEVVTTFAPASPPIIEAALAGATLAFPSWSGLTGKTRGQYFYKFRSLCLEKYRDELVELIVLENGKHVLDATASLLKGIETVEYAITCSMTVCGSTQQVSNGVTCQDRRDPLGIVLCVCPFNFPAMVPMWTIPILLVLGNCVIVKPSEKVPRTVVRMCEIWLEAGVPKGVCSVVHGGSTVVNALIEDTRIKGVTFVGSTPIAKLVYEKSILHGKRAICLGGAKNHLVLLPDADPDLASTDILNSFAGSAGQRCMAASVLVLVGPNCAHILDLLVEKARKIKPGQTGPGEIGPLIDHAAIQRVCHYVDQSLAAYGAHCLVDGRGWAQNSGFWFGPTILVHENLSDPALTNEIFGPVLSVVTVDSLDEAIERVNSSLYGNAACVYTQSGSVAESFTRRANAGMIGVNVGVPVPREPFSFGGTKESKFGISDITGDGLVEFGTVRRKITTKWGNAASFDFVAKHFTG